MDAFKKDHPDIPVLKFNGDDMDFVKNPDDLNVILSALQKYSLKGVEIIMNLRQKI